MLPEVWDVGGSAYDGEEMPLAGHALDLMSAARSSNSSPEPSLASQILPRRRQKKM